MNSLSSPTDDERHQSRQRLLVISVIVVLFTLLLLPFQGVSLPEIFIIVAALLGGGVLFLVSMRRVDIPVLILVGYLPFSKLLVGDFGGLASGLNLFNALFAIILLAMIMNQSDRDISLFSGIDLLLHAFILLSLISLIKGGLFLGEGLVSILLVDFKRWISPMLLFFLIIRVVDERLLRRDIILIVMLVVVLAGVHGLKEFYIDKGDTSSWEKSRIGGIALQPNQLGAFFVYYLPLSISMLYAHVTRLKYWVVLIGPIAIAGRALMLTISRGAFVAFGMAMAGMLFFKNRFISICLILVGVIFIMFPEKMPEIVTGRMQGTVQEHAVVEAGGAEKHLETSSRRRIYALKGGLAIIGEHPFFGVGHNVFPYIIAGYHPLLTHGMDTHNTYLTLATEMGIPALLIFIMILSTIFRHTYRVFKQSKNRFMSTAALGFMSGLVGLVISNLFGSRLNALEITGLFWILAAVFVRESLELREEEYAEYDREQKLERSMDAERP